MDRSIIARITFPIRPALPSLVTGIWKGLSYFMQQTWASLLASLNPKCSTLVRRRAL